MAEITCLQCGARCEAQQVRVASISGSVLGDESTDVYFLCDQCGYYTIEVCYEPFCGEEEVSFRGPIERSKGDAAVALIRQCDRPWDKKCRCEAHIAYFRGTLD